MNGALQNVPGQDNLEYTLPFPIAPPNGETEEQFESALKRNADNYQTNTGGSLPYGFVVQNSNSLFVGLADSVGLNGSNLLQFFPGIWFPGSGHPIGAATFLPHC